MTNTPLDFMTHLQVSARDETLGELETELTRCIGELEKMAEDPARGYGETVRLDGKVEGLMLALEKVREMKR